MIHPGVDLTAGALGDPPPGPPRALCLGALVPWKRADLALEIAARVPDLRLDIAGAPLPGDPPGFAAALRDRAQQPDLAGRVRLLGAVARTRARCSPAPTACCTAPTASRSGWRSSRRSPRAARSSRPPPPARSRSSRPACGRLYAPGSADAGASALRAVLAEPDLRAGARARALHFDGAGAARRFAAVVAPLV